MEFFDELELHIFASGFPWMPVLCTVPVLFDGNLLRCGHHCGVAVLIVIVDLKGGELSLPRITACIKRIVTLIRRLTKLVNLCVYGGNTYNAVS